jgi:CheY-like chemotaxis protein
MPLTDGWEFMRRQRLEPAIAEIPVVVITALVSTVPASAKALVTKRVDVNRLMSLVPEILHVPKLAILIFSRGISWTSR